MIPERGRGLARLLLLGLLWCAATVSWAQPLPPPQGPGAVPQAGAYQAFLVTYGPGEIYWQRFGHDAIWLREPALGLDHSFNFGFFDFEQESFLRRFVQGRMLYFAAAAPARVEQGWYREEGRSIRVQALNLTPLQYQRLRDHLLWHVQPENRDYLYDYYLDNCATRLRDALDIALDGRLSSRFRSVPAAASFRDHTRRSTVMDFWYYLGLELVLGLPVDQPISRWDELFLPVLLADALLEMDAGPGGAPLVAEEQLVYAGGFTPPPAKPPTAWPRYLLAGLGLLLALALWIRFTPGRLHAGTGVVLALLAGTVGAVLLVLAVWTDHSAVRPNFNLLLFNPPLLLAPWSAARRWLAALLAAGLAAALVLAVTGSGQYNADVLAFTGPLLAWLVAWLWRDGARRPER